MLLSLPLLLAALLSPPPAGTARIQGKILHPAGKVVTVQLGRQKPVEAPVDAAGRFTLTVPVKEAGAATLETGDEYTPLWLAPGDDLTVSLDAEKFDETVKYTGIGARVNNYLAAEMLGSETLNARTEKAWDRAPAAFAAFADSVQAVQKQALNAALGTKPTPAETAFRTWKEREQAYELAARRLRYGTQHNVPATDAYYGFVSNPATPLDNPAALASEAYQGYVPAALAYYAQTAGAPPATSPLEMAVLRQAARRLSGPVREAVVPRLLQEGVMYAPLAIADSVQRYALSRLTLPVGLRKQVEESWAARQRTAPGLPAPDLHAVDTDGKAFEWASVRGKVVYLDFWASWCGPCIDQMPAAQKLHAALYDRAADVVFLNVSVDGNAANWRKAMTKHNVEGRNLHSAGDWESSALRAYGISSIPRYLIIGRDGRIVNGDAPRPSDGAEEAIRAALAAKK
mgnify:FL=1